MHHQPVQARRTPRFVGAPLLVQLLQTLDRAFLGSVGDETTAFERTPVQRTYVAQVDQRSSSNPSRFPRFSRIRAVAPQITCSLWLS